MTTFEHFYSQLSDAAKCRFLVSYHNLKRANCMSRARRWRANGNEGAMHSQLIHARLENVKAQLFLREARRLEEADGR